MKEYCINSDCILREFCQKAMNANDADATTMHHPRVVRNVSSTELTIVDVICKGWKKRRGIPEIRGVKDKRYVPLSNNYFNRLPKQDDPLPF